MNCTEVGELMQRHLDYDLDESELEILMTHLSECAQCTELFERLTLLSGSLEQLPRVTPSISIVDAILPELDKIDRAKVQASRRAVAKRNRIWTTIGSIATAAAIVILMVNLNGNSQLNSSNMAMDVARMNPTTSSDSAESTQDAVSMYKMIDEAGDVLNQDLLSKIIVPTTSFTTRENSSSEGGEASSSTYPNEFNTPPVEEAENTATEGPLSIEPPLPSTDSSAPQEQNSIDAGALGGESLSNDDVAIVDDANEGQVSITNQRQDKYFSSDEKLYVQVAQHSIAVYETSTDRLVQQWELSEAGNTKFLAWDKTGASFTTQTLDENGEVNSSQTWKITEK